MRDLGRVVGTMMVVALLAVCATIGSVADVTSESILTPTGAPAAGPPASRNALRERFVRIDRSRIGNEVKLALFPDVTVEAKHQRTEITGPTGNVWIGTLVGEKGSVFLSTVDDVTVGHIRTQGKLYKIRYVAGGVNAVAEIDLSAFPDEGCDDAGSAGGQASWAPDTSTIEPPLAEQAIASDPCGVIDIMVLYTPAAKDSNGGAAAIEALIHLAISVSNVSFQRSGVTTRFSPVHIDEIEYTEAATTNANGDAFDDRNRLRDPSDNIMDEAHTLRDRYCADVVHLITDTGGNGNNNWCGAAYTMDPAPDPGHEVKGFAVTVADCAVDNFTFAHEMGHLFGARHDWYVSGEDTPYTYAHGYVNRPERWRTIMAYNTECDDTGVFCTREGVWSSPHEFVDGDPAGVAENTSTDCVEDDLNNPDCDAENWRVLNATDCTVANFRDRGQCIQSGARNVWMKDTWFDTGLEPDFWTAGQDMWKSPYVWVRHDLDTTGEKQHLHQNPEFGETNHVYVKLHNDFDVASTGQLRMYYADASTGLTWPGDWTQFADTAVNIAAHATLLQPSSWTPPGTGHYCLLARWSTPNSPNDPMTVAEGNSVSSNTRNNNNIVWRNVNIVNLEPDFPAEVPSITVKPTLPTTTIFDLAIELPDNDHNFLRAGGEILLDLGGLHDNWIASGGGGDGVRPTQHPLYGDVVTILDTSSGVATLENIQVAPTESEQVRFILTAPFVPPPPPFPPIDDDPDERTGPPSGDDAVIPRRPVNTFGLEIVQIEQTERVGGVGYEIHVAPTGGAGAVPDGHLVSGTPLLLSLDEDDTLLTLDWDDSCSGTDVDYAVYEGFLGDFASHVPVTCETGGTTTATLPLTSTTDSYFLVVPTDDLTNGSFGTDSRGVERIAGTAACRPHAVVSCD